MMVVSGMHWSSGLPRPTRERPSPARRQRVFHPLLRDGNTRSADRTITISKRIKDWFTLPKWRSYVLTEAISKNSHKPVSCIVAMPRGPECAAAR
jgi:hypothetical protein